MRSFLVSEDIPESQDALKTEVERLRRLNEQLVRELEKRNGPDHKGSNSDATGDYQSTPQRIDDAFRESEARFRQVTDNISEVLWLQTHDYSSLLYISPAYETVWGRTRESLYADPYSFLEAVHPEDRWRVEQTIKENQETGFSSEYRIVKGDGSVRWIRDRGFPIKNEQGIVYRIAGIAEDITDRKAEGHHFRQPLSNP